MWCLPLETWSRGRELYQNHSTGTTCDHAVATGAWLFLSTLCHLYLYTNVKWDFMCVSIAYFFSEYPLSYLYTMYCSFITRGISDPFFFLFSVLVWQTGLPVDTPMRLFLCWVVDSYCELNFFFLFFVSVTYLRICRTVRMPPYLASLPCPCEPIL